MPSYSPELIQTMRAALDEVMTKIPLDQATPGSKGPDQLRCIVESGIGQHSNNSLDADVNSVAMGKRHGARKNPASAATTGRI